jgi:hypothetical protein
VYLIPTTYDFTEADLPTHPCLTLERVCEQPLSTVHNRQAVVMRKSQAYTDERENEFITYKEAIMAGTVCM